MVGRKNGVSARLKSDSSGLVSVHCVAHRLALAASQALEGIPFLEKLQTSISKLFQCIRSSTKRMYKLKELQDMLDDEKVQLVAVHQVRWLSMHTAVRALHKSFPSVLLLEHDASEDQVTAHGLHSFFNTSVALLSVALLRDVLSVITTLSTVFQKKDIEFAAVAHMVNTTLKHLQSMVEVPPGNVASVLGETGLACEETTQATNPARQLRDQVDPQEIIYDCKYKGY